MSKIKKSYGFTLVEVVLSVSIMVLLLSIILNVFVSFRKNQALSKDTETVISLLNQARNQTISSRNSSDYGVHFASTTVTLFTGQTYNAGASDNYVISLSPADTIISLSLNGGGTDVIFKKISGETSQYGTVVVFSTGLPNTKTVTIYGTGVIESN